MKTNFIVVVFGVMTLLKAGNAEANGPRLKCGGLIAAPSRSGTWTIIRTAFCIRAAA